MEKHRLNKVYNGHKLYKGVDPSVDWKLLQTPDYWEYGSGGAGGEMHYANFGATTIPTWEVAQRYTEIRGNVNAQSENKGSSTTCTSNEVSCFDVPYDVEYNKYLLFDTYGWYYCEARYTNLVYLSNGRMRFRLKKIGGGSTDYNDIFDITLTPSNVVEGLAEYPQTQTTKVTYKNGNSDTFSQPMVFGIINFRCLIDLTTRKIYNKVKFATDPYAPFDNIETDVWNYFGEITNHNVYNSLIGNNCRFSFIGQAGAYRTGVNNWYQSGLIWNNLTFNGCKRSNLNIHYV